jgi:hypothetical protein
LERGENLARFSDTTKEAFVVSQKVYLGVDHTNITLLAIFKALV